MFGLNLLTGKVLGGLLLVGACLAGWLYVQHLRVTIEKKEVEISDLVVKGQKLEAQLRDVTQSAKEQDNRLQAANQKAGQASAALDLARKMLKKQNPPKECEKAVEWSIERKDDLKWTE